MAKKFALFIFFILLLSIPAVWPIVAPGFFPVHDDTQVARVQQMYVALKAGQFPVRWVPDLGYGYGYPIFNFYNPLPYYFGAGFMFVGFNALTATKLMYVFPVILSGITMFIFSKLFLSDFASLLAAILYVYAPYHAVQIYVRGAVAEYWAYTLLPLVFWAIWKKKAIFGSLLLATLILSHNLTAFMSIIFIGLLILIQLIELLWRKLGVKSFVICHLSFVILALGASAFFWFPSILESSKTGVDQMVFEKFDPPSQHVVYPLQLWSGVWGYGGSSPGIDDGLSFQVGKIHLIGSLAAIAILLYCYIAKKTIKQFNLAERDPAPQDNLTIFSVVGLILSVFMILPLSRPIWNAFPVLAYIQFPWRFLTFASLFSSILAALAIDISAIRNPQPAIRYILLLASCFLILVSYIPFFQPKFKFPITADELITREKLVWDYSRISDEYLPKGFIPPINAEVALRVDNKQNQLLVDKLKSQTPVRLVADIISLFTLIIFIAFITIIPFYKKHEQNISG